jgi:purine-cytosine permease-like protein
VTPEQVFSVVNLIATAAWLALVILPGRRWVTGIVTSTVVPLLFAIVYVGIVVTTFGRTPGGFSTLEGVATLFSNPWALLAGWIHYLAFDLLIGTWEVRDAREQGLSHLLLVPCLVLTFLLGPAGWLLYRALRLMKSSQMRQSLSSVS